MAGVVSAYLLAVAEVFGIVTSLSGQTVFTEKNLITTIALVVIGTLVTVVAALANLAGALRWFAAGTAPTAPQKLSALKISRRQSLQLVTTWIVSGLVLVPVNLDHGLTVVFVIAMAVLFGATASVCMAFLFTQRTLRPVTACAAIDFETHETAPGVEARLLFMWTVCTAMPGVGIAVLVLLRTNGWIIPKTASVEIPALVLSLAAVLLGLRAMILVSRSISDPVREVVDAMAEVERGQMNTSVDIYERSEIGRLQTGFNRMVAGLRERDLLADLFGRHVGAEVVRRAIQQPQTLTGEVRDVAVLFIDLAGSTQLAASRPPEEVADVLNDFFRIVVAAVDAHNGLINKFQGDAALAVFGAPVRTGESASDALATARDLGTALRRLPVVDYGIGVSAGPVFAGNIGAENRYEYTVIGDAVNEAARLADRAKSADGRVLCSGAAITRADSTERRNWMSHGFAQLRGRSEVTHISAPVV